MDFIPAQGTLEYKILFIQYLLTSVLCCNVYMFLPLNFLAFYFVFFIPSETEILI